jgi:hypothetical protein
MGERSETEQLAAAVLVMVQAALVVALISSWNARREMRDRLDALEAQAGDVSEHVTERELRSVLDAHAYGWASDRVEKLGEVR